MRKITFREERGCIRIFVDGQTAAVFRNSTKLEGEAHLRAFVMGLRWGRNDEFDPIVDKEENSHG